MATVFGFSPRPRFDLVVNTLTAKAICDGKITVFGGDQWRPNVHVSDVAEVMIAVLELPLGKVGGEAFNVGSEKNNMTINEIGKIVHEEVPAAELVMTETAIDKRNYRVDFSKLSALLGYEPRTSVRDGVREVIGAFAAGKVKGYKDSKYSNVLSLESVTQNSQLPS